MSLREIFLAIAIVVGTTGGLAAWVAFVVWIARDLTRSQIRVESDPA